MNEPPADTEGASLHLWITCPHCHRSNLRIRRAHLGRRVYCKHCGRKFRARSGHDPGDVAASPLPAPGGLPASPPAEADRPHGAVEGELPRIRAALASLGADRDAALRELAGARDRLQQAEAARKELEGLRADNERLLAEVEGLRSRATDAAHVERDLRAELQAARARLESIELGRVEATAQELADVRDERDRLEAALRAGAAREEQLQARIREVERRAGEERDQAEDRWRALQAGLDAAGLRLERELPPLRDEAERLRKQAETLVRERDAAIGQIEALVTERDRAIALLEQAEAGREADLPRIEVLAAELDEARAANGRLRSLLDVFGLPPAWDPGPVPPPGRPQPPAPAEKSGRP